MQSLNSLYFPETILPRHLRNCLLLLPDSLHLLQPVEPTKDTPEVTPADDIFMKQGICQVHTPSLPGKDQERFMRLLNEIRTRKDSFAEQLSSLTLAHLSQETNRGDHSRQAIMSSLLDRQVPADTESEEESKKAELWQARLVLALAEILDREEAELASSLADIDDSELALFQDLKGEEAGGEEGEDDSPLAELMRIKAKINQPRPGTVKRRLQAWKTLYSATTLPENFWFWMTSQEEAAELLINNYETQSGRNGVPLLLLDLPEQIYMRDTDGLENIKNFQEKAATVRRDIIEKLSSIVSKEHLNVVDPVALLPDAGILTRDWNDLIEYCFPEERFGRKKLDLQFLANISLGQLVSGKTTNKLCHSIVALYRD
ncbi:MAG: hypothetical protein JKY62_05305 [Desulfocapsa sp.]|uniref:Uncharacterized protein n=1 Tax=Desulfotalea psychrophila TaxID=84980 RepID=A0ABS3AVD0_9BACT|nr:hypothetical protein [Desulfocapsa sp.]MBN4045944.1 hypothetical protein [bacterium AH-315-P11]MBN4068731.1 hypothetical protein [Desulfotalea psychrophila]